MTGEKEFLPPSPQEYIAYLEAEITRTREERDAFKALSNARGHYIEALGIEDLELMRLAGEECAAAFDLLSGLGIHPKAQEDAPTTSPSTTSSAD